MRDAPRTPHRSRPPRPVAGIEPARVGPVTPTGLAALRRSATLAHSLPQVALRLRADGRVLLDVCRPPGAPEGGRWIPPCAFRAAIGEAHARAGGGSRFGCLGLPCGVDPAVDVGVAGTTVLHPGGIVGCDVADQRVVAFATLLDEARTRALVGERLATAAQPLGGPRHLPDGARRVGIRHDPVTDVSLVYVVGVGCVPARVDVELATELASACGAEELVDALAAGHLAVGGTGPREADLGDAP
jgi:hypothetical protein